MPKGKNEYLDHESSDESDVEDGYDSEAAEVAKGARAAATGRSSKRRKLSHSEDNSAESDIAGSDDDNKLHTYTIQKNGVPAASEDEDVSDAKHSIKEQPSDASIEDASKTKPSSTSKSKKKPKDKDIKPGVVYLSSLPPYLKPSALRNLLNQRGFQPITRLFLTPASKAKTGSKKNSRQLYTEGWIEFANKKTAKRCADALNAQIIGGNKRGFYYDDIWNMKYLRGMGWSELMAGIREEKREEEGRRDEERRTIAKETKRFIEGVEEGRRVEGIKRKRSKKAGQADSGGHDRVTDNDIKRTWRQFEVKGTNKGGEVSSKKNKISDDAREVLGKIF